MRRLRLPLSSALGIAASMGIYIARAFFILVGICVMLAGTELHIAAFIAGILVFIYISIFEGDEICSKDVWVWFGAACLFMLVGYITANSYGISVLELDSHREIYRKFRRSFTFGVFCLGMSVSELIALLYIEKVEKSGSETQ